jgi:hypothetical protein
MVEHYGYDEIGDILRIRNIGGKVMLLSKYSLERNNTISAMFCTQYNPHSFVAENYVVCGTLPPRGLRI